MIDFDKFEKASEKFALQLGEICAQLGVEPANFSIIPTTLRYTKQNIIKIINNSSNKPFVGDDGKVKIYYIMDHTDDNDYDTCYHPNGCYYRGKKIHFYNCTTIAYMKKYERYDERYVFPRRFTDKQLIDLPPKRRPRTVETRLAFCQNCIWFLLDEIKSGKRKWENDDKTRKTIAEYGNFMKLINCIQLWADDASEFKSELDKFIEQTLIHASLLKKESARLRKEKT